jgi:hypothetical protein
MQSGQHHQPAYSKQRGSKKERKKENREGEKKALPVRISGLVPDERTAHVIKGIHKGTD